MLTVWLDGAIVTAQENADGGRWAFGYRLQVQQSMYLSARLALDNAAREFARWKHPGGLTRRDDNLLAILPTYFIGLLAAFLQANTPAGALCRLCEKSRRLEPLEFIWLSGPVKSET